MTLIQTSEAQQRKKPKLDKQRHLNSCNTDGRGKCLTCVLKVLIRI